MSLSSDWQINKKNYSERGRYLLKTGQWSDCEFIVGQEPQQQRLKGHKLLLAMSSPVFAAMFFGSMEEKIHPIPIIDVQPDTFKALLEYIYTDCIDLSSFEVTCELFYSAKKYMLPLLIEECMEFLCTNLSPGNACKAYELAKLFEDPVLMQKSFEFICSHTNEVLNESTWDEVEFGTLVSVLEQDILQIDSEVELYSALEHWTKAECLRKSLDYNDRKTSRSLIENALFKIRFLTLTPQEFGDGLGVSWLLTQDEVLGILMNLACTVNKIPMPEGFSTNTSRRTKVKYYYCRHPKTITNYMHYEGDLCSSIGFMVDRDIYILAIKVPTQVDNKNGDTSSMYTINLEVYIRNSNNYNIAWKHVSTKVQMGTLIEIRFDHPVPIRQDDDYQVGVVYKTPGCYPSSVDAEIKTCRAVSFNCWSNQTTYSGYKDFIRSIIFRLHPKINCVDDIELQPA